MAEEALGNAHRHYHNVMNSFPSLLFQLFGKQSSDMKEAEEYLKTRKQWWEVCQAMCDNNNNKGNNK